MVGRWCAPQLLLAVGFAVNGLVLYVFTKVAQLSLLMRFGGALQFLLTLAALALLVKAGCRRPVSSFLSGMLVGFAFEVLGTRTGIPFGAYEYRWAVPSLLEVPVQVVYGWGLYITTSYMVALSLESTLLRVFHASLLTVALDMAIDPVMVSYGLWRWARAGEWFGIPLENFAGWFTVSAVSLLLAESLSKAESRCPLSWKCSTLCYLAAYAPFIAASTPATAAPVLVATLLGAALATAPQLVRRAWPHRTREARSLITPRRWGLCR